MVSFEITDPVTLIAFWLVFTRWMAILIQLPLFDNVAVPTVVKALSALLISYTFFPFLQGQMESEVRAIGEEHFWLMTIYSSLIGLSIGYVVKSIMNIFISAGSIITQQIGFAAIRYFDPASSTQIGPFEQLMQWTMLVMVISSGALIPMLNGVYLSFFNITMVAPGDLSQMPGFFIQFFKSIFISGILLASPLIFINILLMSVLGIIARTVPQMNIIMVSFAVNIGMGLLVFTATSDEFFHVA